MLDQLPQKIRIGVLGCANIAVRSIIPELAIHPQFQLAGIASRSAEKREALASEYNCGSYLYEDLINERDVDAIYIPLPTGLHYEWVMKCLRSGKHVLCEKSLGCSLAEVKDIVLLAENHGLLVMENFQFRFHSQNAYVKNVLASGQLGEIRCFRASFGFPPFADGMKNIRYRKDLGGGALLDAGAYTLKASSFFLGHDLSVKAATKSFQRCCEVDTYGSAYLIAANGAVAETAYGFDNFYQCGYEIWGSQGKLTTKRAFTAPPGLAPEISVETKGKNECIKLSPDNHFANMLTYFSETIKSGRYETEYAECLTQARLIQEVVNVIGI